MLNGLNQPEEWQATPARLGCLGCLDAVDVTMVSPVRDSYYPSSPSMSFLTLMVSDAFCQIIYIYMYIYVYMYIAGTATPKAAAAFYPRKTVAVTRHK